MPGEQYSADIKTGVNDPRYRIQSFLLAIVTAVTVFAALPVFFESTAYKAVLLFVWGTNFIFNAALFKISLTKTSAAILLSWIFYIIYCTALYIVHGNGYINGTYFYSVNLCIFVYINGCFLSHEQTGKVLNTVLTVYNICSVVVLLYIYFTNFWSIQYLEVETYIYSAKNSIGPIIVSNMIILAIRGMKGSTLVKVFRLVCELLSAYLLLLVNNRAGVIELAAVLLCYAVFAYKNQLKADAAKSKDPMKKPPVLAVLALCWAVLIAAAFYGKIVIDKVSGFLKWALKLDQVYDLNSFSSGRISLYYLALNQAIRVSPLFGVGIWYTDLFYLSLLAEVGIIGVMPILVMILAILYTAVRNLKSKDRWALLMALLAVQVLAASFFEGLPPFGPGTVVFVFWLLFGACTGSKAINIKPKPALRSMD